MALRHLIIELLKTSNVMENYTLLGDKEYKHLPPTERGRIHKLVADFIQEKYAETITEAVDDFIMSMSVDMLDPIAEYLMGEGFNVEE